MRREGESEEGLTTNSGPDSTSSAILCPSRQKGFYSQTTSSGLKILSQTWAPDTYTAVKQKDKRMSITTHMQNTWP